jgi:hypothetical protein
MQMETRTCFQEPFRFPTEKVRDRGHNRVAEQFGPWPTRRAPRDEAKCHRRITLDVLVPRAFRVAVTALDKSEFSLERHEKQANANKFSHCQEASS